MDVQTAKENAIFTKRLLCMSIVTRAAAVLAAIAVISALVLNPDFIFVLKKFLGLDVSKFSINRAVMLFGVMRAFDIHADPAKLLFFSSLFLLSLTLFLERFNEKAFVLAALAAAAAAAVVSSSVSIWHILAAVAGIFLIYGINSLDVEKLKGLLSRIGILRCFFAAFMLIPFIAEVFFPSLALFFVRNSVKLGRTGFSGRAWDRICFFTAFAIGANLVVNTLVQPVYRYDIFRLTGDPELTIIDSKRNYYGMEIDFPTGRLLACRMKRNNILVFDLNNIDIPPLWVQTESIELQDIRINIEKRELYHFERGGNRLLVLDLDSFGLKKKSAELAGTGSARVEYNKVSDTIAVTRENDYLWVLDADTLEPVIHDSEAGYKNEYITSDPAEDTYYITYFDIYKKTTAVQAKKRIIKETPVPLHQGASAVSTARNEIYIALPLRAEILVLDRNTMEKKRTIPTVFGARGLAYDDTNDLLVVASMCTGYAEIIEMRPPVKRRRVLVGRNLREVCLNPSSREAFMSSPHGLYRLRY